MSKFVITMKELGKTLYYAGDSTPFWKSGSMELKHAKKFDSRSQAEEWASLFPSQHPFKLGVIEEVTF